MVKTDLSQFASNMGQFKAAPITDGVGRDGVDASRSLDHRITDVYKTILL